MFTVRTSIIGLFALSLTACGTFHENSGDENSNSQATEEEVLDRISGIEDAIEIAKGDQIIYHSHRLADVLKSYADKFPKDSLAPEMLFKSANVYITVNEFEKSAHILQRIRKNYPGWIKIPETIFMQGFVYDYYLGQKGKAQGYYEELLEKYPDHAFAKDARASIQNLGKTDEELIREFEERQKREEAEEI